MGLWNRINLGALAVAGALTLGAPRAAQALDATGCFTPVGGIDGVNPDYKTLNNGVNDARWNGSFGYGWQTGSLGEAEFKAITGTDPDVAGQRMMYLSWRHLITSSSIKANEGIQLGFGFVPSGSTDQVSQILYVTFGRPGDPDITAPTPRNADGTITGQPPASAQLLRKIGSNDTTTWPTTSPSGNAWLKSHTAMFVVQDTPGGPLYWVVQMGVPVTTTVPDATKNWDTKAVYIDPNAFLTPSLGIHYWADIMGSPMSMPAVVYRPWPDPGLDTSGKPLIVNQNRDSSSYKVPSPDHWSSMEPGVPNPSSGLPTCSGKGLTFVGGKDIHNNAASGDWVLNMYQQTSPTSATGAANDVSVSVHNDSMTSYNAADVTAKFSIAPYGSQTARSASWAPLYIEGNGIACDSQPAPGVCTNPHPAGGTVIGSAFGAGSGDPGMTFTLHTATPWKPNQSYVCAIVDEAGNPYDARPELSSFCSGQPWLPSGSGADGLPEHQCMQVELSATGATGGVQFANKSAFRNMHASHASLHHENAIIDSSGLPRNGSAKGHYIYLYVETRNMPHVVTKNTPPVGASKERGNVSYDDLATYAPTFVVHAYADTGYTTRFGKSKLKILEPMTSYGNFVSHQGALYGWDALLEGAEKVGKDTYRIWLDNNATGVVTTHIEALEHPRCQGTVTLGVVDLLASLVQVLEQTNPYWAGQINQVIASCDANVTVQCDDLNRLLDDVAQLDWGVWSSWVQSLIAQIKANTGCSC